MSFSLTTEAIRNRTKTVTRRKGWWKDKRGRRLCQVGDTINACVKCMGLKPGEKIERICQLRVVSVTRENLSAIHMEPDGTAREGFPDMSAKDFISMFCKEMGGHPYQFVTRIQFEFVEGC